MLIADTAAHQGETLVLLAMPLVRHQLDAAGRTHRQLEQWQRSDAALTQLRGTVPDVSSEACLLKAVAVNSLYGAQVFATMLEPFYKAPLSHAQSCS